MIDIWNLSGMKRPNSNTTNKNKLSENEGTYSLRSEFRNHFDSNFMKTINKKNYSMVRGEVD